MNESRPLVYLAVPYSHPDPTVRQRRFELVNKVAAKLITQGLYIFSPISHTHPIALAGALAPGWEYWQNFDRAYLAHCHKIIVLTLPGWQESKGVTGELAIAREMGLEVEYVKYENYEN